MNLILLFRTDFSDGTNTVRIGGRRLKHVLEVHHAKPGDTLSIGLEGGKMGTGTVTHIDREVLEMDTDLHQDPPEPLPLLLILALPRPKVLRRVLSSATAMGVKRIVLLNAYRVEKSFWQSPVLNEEQLRKQLVLGLEQAKDTVFPDILLRTRFKPFLEDELPRLAGETLKIAAHPPASEKCPRNPGGPVTLAVGPEGGFIPYEMEAFVSVGFSAVSLGERILSVETALPYLVSRLF